MVSLAHSLTLFFFERENGQERTFVGIYDNYFSAFQSMPLLEAIIISLRSIHCHLLGFISPRPRVPENHSKFDEYTLRLL